MEASFELVRTFSAPVERVWQGWVDPEMVRDWYGPTEEPCRVEAMDVRPGGAYRRFMGDHLDEGRFFVVEAPHRLEQGTADRKFLIDTRLEPEGDGTRMVLRMYGTDPAADGHMRAAWNAGFDKMDRIL